MTLARNIVSGTAGERVVVLVELSHPEWSGPLRYAEDTRDWTVTMEDESEATFTSTGFDGEAPPIADTGVDARAFALPDLDGELWRRIESLIGVVDDETGRPVPIAVTVRQYLSTDTDAPQTVGALALSSPSRNSNRAVQFTATTADYVNRNAPAERYTWTNSPGLRGR